MEWKIRLQGEKKWDKYSYPYPIDVKQRIKDWLIDHPEFFIKSIKSDLYKVLNVEVEDNQGDINTYEVDISLNFTMQAKNED